MVSLESGVAVPIPMLSFALSINKSLVLKAISPLVVESVEMFKILLVVS